MLSTNIRSLKNSTAIKKEEENLKNNKNKIIENSNINNNQNIINNNESEITNSTQLDWVKSAIQVKTKNNAIIKLSLNNENFFEPSKIKVNKLKRYKDLDFKTKYKEKDENNETKFNENININNRQNFEKFDINNNNFMNSNKIDNKESGYMMASTKESEKLDYNFKYLSNRKNKNIELYFPTNSNNINYDNNDEEDMVNMKTLSIFNVNTEIDKSNLISTKNKIYKKRVLGSKKNSNNFIRPKIFDNRNSNYILNKIKNKTNDGKMPILNAKKSKNNEFIIDFDNKYIFQKHVSFSNKNKSNNNKNDSNDFENNFLFHNNSNLNLTSKQSIVPYLNKRKHYKFLNNRDILLNMSEFKVKKSSMFTNYINTEKTDNKENPKINCINIDKNNNYIKNNNKIVQNYKFITPNKSIFKKGININPSSNFIKKNISQKFLLSPNNKSNLLLRNFLSQINLSKYFSVLKLNGFDNINLLIEQMKSNDPIKDTELKKAGITIPGDRAKILIRLEEKGGLFPFHVHKNVYYSSDDNADDYNKDKDENIIGLKRWLKEFKLEEYLDNFIKNGYHSVELFLYQMISKNPINNNILYSEIGIEKIGHRSRILSILKEESKKMKEKLEKKEPINFMDETQNCECFIF